MIQGRTQRSRDRLDLRDSVGVEDGFGDPLDQDHAGGVAQVVVGFDHHQFGIEPGPGEVALGRRVALIGGGAGRHVGAGVVTGLVSGQSQQTDEGHSDRHRQNRPGPAHDRRSDATPAPGPHRAGRFEHAEVAADRDQGRRERQRGYERHADTDRGGNAEAVEVGQPGEGQAEHGAGDGEARPPDDVCGPAIHVVERGHPLLTVLARFVVAAQEEDRVVRPGRDHQQRQEIRRVRRQPDDSRVGQQGDDAAGRGQLHQHRQQDQGHGAGAAVEPHQHHCDHAEGDQRRLEGAFAAHLELVGDQGRGPGDVGPHPRWPWGVVDDVTHGVDRLVRQRLALVAGQVDLDQRRLAVGALRRCRRQRVTPVVLDVLHMRGVAGECADQPVVVAVRLRAERLVALEDDHRRTVGVELVEHLADVFAGL